MSDDFPKMVGWYQPKLLLKAALEVVVSSLFGQHADQRTVQALTGNAKLFDYSSGELRVEPIDTEFTYGIESQAEKSVAPTGETGEDFWFDYVADLGDGWHSTYSMAYLLTRPKLEVAFEKNQAETLESGKVLIFGGDQVYPTATRDDYDRRFLGAYEAALQDGLPRQPTEAYAIPGNHDWYDSLRSFSRIFFTKHKLVPGTKIDTPQSRSYFAIKLPGNWWLLATDVQLGSDIDANQLEYFRAVREKIQPHDNVILCTAEPHWAKPKKVEKRESISAPSALDRLEQDVLGNKCRVFVAGDVHHYMRYQSVPNGHSATEFERHKITAGGGGAFLHPTHRSWPKTISEPRINATTSPPKFERPENAVYPSPGRSFALSFWNWVFPIVNPRFGILTAILYLVFTMMMFPAHQRYTDNKTKAGKDAAINELLTKLKGLTPAAASADNEATNTSLDSQLAQIQEINIQRTRNISEQKQAIEKVIEEGFSDDTEKGEARVALNKYIKTLESIDRSNKGFVHNTRDSLRRKRITNSGLRPGRVLDSTKKTGNPGEVRGPPTVDDGSPSTLDTRTKSNGKTKPEAQEQDPAPPFLTAAVIYFWELFLQEAKIPDPFESLLAILVFITAVGGFIAFTDIPNPIGRFLLGGLHGCMHWFFAFLISMLIIGAFGDALEGTPFTNSGTNGAGQTVSESAQVLTGGSKEKTVPWFSLVFMILTSVAITIAYGVTADKPGQSFVRRSVWCGAFFGFATCLYFVFSLADGYENSAVAVAVFVFGWLAGAWLMGMYLWLAHTIFGQHWNESFSAVRSQDWKCFLRFRVSKDGVLSIYPIGVPSVCRKWEREGQHYKPSSALNPILIEPPVIVQGRSKKDAT